MNKAIGRMMDANINRASEGIRVTEDYVRFVLDDQVMMARLRTLRHRLRKQTDIEWSHYRDSGSDVGQVVSHAVTLDDKATLKQVVKANLLRAQEALRVLEEVSKLTLGYPLCKTFEHMRFEVYAIEKELFKPMPMEGLYAITSEGTTDEVLHQVAMWLDEGIQLIQYRDKKRPLTDQIILGRAIKGLIGTREAYLIANDSLALAKAIDADGIHVGQTDQSVAEVRHDYPGKLIGVSTHNGWQLEKALLMQPDYIAVGPMFETKSKPDVEASQGLSYAKWAREKTTIPLVAIGGIDAGNMHTLTDMGITCLAMISALKDRKSVKDHINTFNQLMKRG